MALRRLAELSPGELKNSSLKFVTLTFPNVTWANGDEAKAWMEDRTKMLREFFPTRAKDKSVGGLGWQVRGYLAVWEITPGKSGGAWHPHLHILMLSPFINVPDLRRRWHALTGASQVDVQRVKFGGAGVSYVLKYLAKPWEGVPDDLQCAALYRTRRLTSVGEFYNARLNALTARLMERSEKVSWHLDCPKCERATPGDHGEDVRDLDGCARPWKPPEGAPPEWATVRIREVVDYAAAAAFLGRELDPVRDLPCPPAVMVPVLWNGLPPEYPARSEAVSLDAAHPSGAALPPESDSVPF